MKKIFTLAAAVLFSIGMMADVAVVSFNLGKDGAEASGANSITGASGCDAEGFTVAITGNTEKSWSGGNGSITYNEKTYKTLKNSNGAQNTITLPDGCNATKVVFYAVTNDGSTKAKLTEINGTSCSDEVTSLKDYANPTVIEKTLDDAASFTFTFSTKQVCFIAVVTYTSTPVANPVTTVTISGKNECYTGKSVTLTATTDVKADNYQWFVNDVAQNEAINKSFDFTPAADGNYNIVCKAKNANNTDWVASSPFVVTATTKVMQDELVAVNDDITWDFANIEAANVAPDTEVANDTLIFANLYAEWATGFAADKIAGKAQYFYYTSNQCFQGHVLKFVTTVPGKVAVEYSNTGGDRPYRHVRVNGVLSAKGSASTEKITSEEFAVEAGEVLIDFYIPDATQPKEKEGQVVGVQMARVYKVVFTKTEATGFENVGINGKAVKVVRDGQVLILRDGKMYNALGAEVK